MGQVMINIEKCKGCGLCVVACPVNILRLSETELNSKGYRPAECFDIEKCIGCANCARMCPDVVIEVDR